MNVAGAARVAAPPKPPAPQTPVRGGRPAERVSALHPAPPRGMQQGVPGPARPEPLAGQRQYPASRSNRRTVLLCLALGAAVVFGLVLMNIYVAQSSFRFGDVQAQVAQQEATQRRLRLAIAAAEAPDRVAAAALVLGLVPPADLNYLQGPAGPATGASPTGSARPASGAGPGAAGAAGGRSFAR